MWGTPLFLSRVIVTSSRGFVVDSTWSAATPKEASLKKSVSFWSVRPVWPATRAS